MGDDGAGLHYGWRRLVMRMVKVCYVGGTGLPCERRGLENVIHAGAAFRAYMPSVGAGLSHKIKLAPSVIQTCAAHGTDLRHRVVFLLNG